MSDSNAQCNYKNLVDNFNDIFLRTLESLCDGEDTNPSIATFINPIVSNRGVKEIVQKAVGGVSIGGYAAADCVEYEGCADPGFLKITFDVPGTKKNDIKLDLVKHGSNNGYLLKLTATRKHGVVAPGGKVISNERFVGTKAREFILPGDVDPNSVNAKHEDGVLTVTIHKVGKKESSSKSIPIQ